MSKEIVKVGDVWDFVDNEYAIGCQLKITHVGELHVLYTITTDKAPNEYVMTIDKITLSPNYNIIKRDGKPYKPERVFEDGAFYPAIYEGDQVVIRCIDVMKQRKQLYPGSLKRIFSLNKLNFKAIHFTWIGEKLDIDWPEQEKGE